MPSLEMLLPPIEPFEDPQRDHQVRTLVEDGPCWWAEDCCQLHRMPLPAVVHTLSLQVKRETLVPVALFQRRWTVAALVHSCSHETMPAAAAGGGGPCHPEQPHQRRLLVAVVLDSVLELRERIPLTFAVVASLVVAAEQTSLLAEALLLPVLPEPRTWAGTSLPCLDTHPTTTLHLALVWREW
jgi:hypothetical protein